MLRSMYSGISGMKNFQTKLDVVGNNIANVNTAGFKKGRITFQDLMSQTSSPAQGGDPDGGGRGGVNAIQVGTGAQIGSIDNVHTQGFKQNTERPLDLMLEGDGFFVVDTGDGPAYTRAGNFSLDNDGHLVTSDGYYVYGFPLDDKGEISGNVDDINTDSLQKIKLKIEKPDSANLQDEGGGNDNTNTEGDNEAIKSFSISKNGTVQYTTDNGNTGYAGRIAIGIFANDGGLEKAGENLWLETDGSGGATYVPGDSQGAASIESGALEMSNVDLSEEFTEMITAQRGFQANTRIITTSDEILQELVNLKR